MTTWMLSILLMFCLPCTALFLFQNNASKLLLAIMESRHDSENAERILYNMRPKELVSGIYSIGCKMHMQNSAEDNVKAKLSDSLVCDVHVQVEVIKKAYMQGELEPNEPAEEDEDGEEEHAASPQNVGHNIYILAHQVL